MSDDKTTPQPPEEADSQASSATAGRRAVLITGAAGYIGHLVTLGLAKDRRDLETIVASDVRPVPEAKRVEGVVYEVLDVRAPEVSQVIARYGIDTVVHLASIVNPGPESTRELEYDVDVNGTRNVLEACAEGRVRKLVVTSSGAAYGYHPDNPPLLTEDSPVRGDEAFAYSHHKRLVEEMLAAYRESHPALEQLVFRPGTVLGENVSNQITNLFEKPVVLGVKGFASPFVIIWDQDVVNCIVEGVHGSQTGIFNLAGDGVMTLREMADRLGKPYLPVSPSLLERALTVLSGRGLTRYGPEQMRFLQYRPVLSNERLKREFGYRPQKTTREVFDLYVESRRRPAAVSPMSKLARWLPRVVRAAINRRGPTKPPST